MGNQIDVASSPYEIACRVCGFTGGLTHQCTGEATQTFQDGYEAGYAAASDRIYVLDLELAKLRQQRLEHPGDHKFSTAAPKKLGRVRCTRCGVEGPVPTEVYQPTNLCPSCAVSAVALPATSEELKR